MRVFQSLERMKQGTVLVCGDFMLDVYTTGSVHRISPEAPVPVLKVEKAESLPGGAGNVVLNLLSLGMNVVVAGRIGDDDAGRTLKEAFEKEHANTSALLVQKGYTTPLKNRLIADAQQLLRIDTEESEEMSDLFEEKLLLTIAALLPDIDVLAISDYAKGGISSSFCSRLIELAKNFSIPILVDPKGLDFSKYSGATLIKPNKKEAYAAAKLDEKATVNEVAKTLLEETRIEHVMITRSEEGISLWSQNGVEITCPVKSKEVVDVTGAGDTVLACITACMVNDIPMQDALHIANCAASIAIEHLGCYRVTLSEISKRFLKHDTGNKIFSKLQLTALKQVLRKQPYTLIVLENVDELTLDLFSEIQSFCGIHPDHTIVVYLKADPVRGDVVSLLSSFREIHFIIEQPECMSSILSTNRPSYLLVWEKYGLKDRTPSHTLLSDLLSVELKKV